MTKELNTPTDIAAEKRGDRVAVWSMDNDLLLSKQPAIDGNCTIKYTAWSERAQDDVTVKYNAVSPTYSDLLAVANHLIMLTDDRHHIFVEDFMYDEVDGTWVLQTGS